MKSIATTLLLIMALAVGCKAQKNVSSAEESMAIEKNTEAINAFYSKALTVNGETNPSAVLSPLLAEGYKSSSSTDFKEAAQLIGQVAFFWKLVPDLQWKPQEIISEGNTYVVRSIATGTPNGDFMGIHTNGTKSFEILTIDIHKMQNGKFLSTHHVEDWATAMKQLKPKQESKPTATMDVAMAFMDAMGKGDMEKMKNLIHEDMVWHNEGDKSMPWIGPWNGKKAILEDFMPSFGANFKTIKWQPDDALSTGNTAAFFGRMIGLLTKSDQQTKEFTYALRVKVKDGKVILWNWFEDSFEVSQSYHSE